MTTAVEITAMRHGIVLRSNRLGDEDEQGAQDKEQWHCV